MTKSIVQQEIDFYNRVTGKNYRNVPDAKRAYYLKLAEKPVVKDEPKEDKPKPEVRRKPKED